jgi:hypothetical protein
MVESITTYLAGPPEGWDVLASSTVSRRALSEDTWTAFIRAPLQTQLRLLENPVLWASRGDIFKQDKKRPVCGTCFTEQACNGDCLCT